MGLLRRILSGDEDDDLNRLQDSDALVLHVYLQVHESRIYPLILEMLKRRGLIRFGDAIIMDRGFYAYKNYLIGIRYGIVPLIIPKKKFRLEKLKGLLSYPLFIFNKNVEKEKKRYKA